MKRYRPAIDRCYKRCASAIRFNDVDGGQRVNRGFWNRTLNHNIDQTYAQDKIPDSKGRTGHCNSNAMGIENDAKVAGLAKLTSPELTQRYKEHRRDRSIAEQPEHDLEQPLSVFGRGEIA